MDLHLAGRVAVVTGASRGIGLACASTLADEGANVVASARTITPELAALESDHFLPVSADLSAPEGAQFLIDAAVQRFGGVDILINNAGAMRNRRKGLTAIPDEEWLWGLDANLLMAVRATRAALPHLLEKQHANIVNISSVMAFLADPDVYDYTAGKAALTNFSKALSKELGTSGVRVNTVSPGPTNTGLWTRPEGGIAPAASKDLGIDQDSFLRDIASRMATGRFTEPAEVADLVTFLASDRAGNVHGADYFIDGGLIATMT